MLKLSKKLFKDNEEQITIEMCTPRTILQIWEEALNNNKNLFSTTFQEMAYIKFFEKSDLTNSTAQIICHQVNCQGKMGSGVALAIRNKFPNVYNEYIFKHNNEGTKLGDLQIVEINSNCRNTKEHSQFVANIAGQFNYGYDGKRYTSYDAFYD